MTNRTAQSVDLGGHYKCEGGDYRGEVAIRDLGGSFAVHWTISGSVQVGVGIRSGNALGVSIGIPVTAVVLYEVHPGPMLQGRFCSFPGGGPVREEVLRFSHALREWEVGNEVLAKWSRDPFWYPASITEKRLDDQYCVRFADGDEEWLGQSRIMADRLTVGDIVYNTGGLLHLDESGQRAITKLDPTEFDTSRIGMSCRVISRDGDTLRLEYEDGVTIQTTICNIRTMAPREA
jgi:hypothetical protein